MDSKITGGKTTFLFNKKILGKHDVNYYCCDDTGYIQTTEPYWLEEAYSNAITKLDIGLVLRNQNISLIAENILTQHFNHNSKFLDYAGGYGLFTRMMRDKGFDFYNTDKFCENIFAEFHDLNLLPANYKFELITAFEVLEHLSEPFTVLDEIFTFSENLFFTTEIIPIDKNELENWWYLSLETGQHVAFYSIKSLEYIAKKYNKYFFTNGKWLHLFTDKKLEINPFDYLTFKPKENYFIRKARRILNRFYLKNNLNFKNNKISLIESDWLDAKKRITKN